MRAYYAFFLKYYTTPLAWSVFLTLVATVAISYTYSAGFESRNAGNALLTLIFIFVYSALFSLNTLLVLKIALHRKVFMQIMGKSLLLFPPLLLLSTFSNQASAILISFFGNSWVAAGIITGLFTFLGILITLTLALGLFDTIYRYIPSLSTVFQSISKGRICIWIALSFAFMVVYSILCTVAFIYIKTL